MAMTTALAILVAATAIGLVAWAASPAGAKVDAPLCHGRAHEVDSGSQFWYRLGARCHRKVVQIKVRGWISPKPPGNTIGTKDYFHRNCPLYPKHCMWKSDRYSFYITQGCVRWKFHYTWYTTHGSHTRRERGHKGGAC